MFASMATIYALNAILGPVLGWLAGGATALVGYLAFLQFKHYRSLWRLEAQRRRLGLCRQSRRSVARRLFMGVLARLEVAAPPQRELRLPPRCTGFRSHSGPQVRKATRAVLAGDAAYWRWPLTVRMKVSSSWTANVVTLATRTGSVLAPVSLVPRHERAGAGPRA